MPRTRLIPSDPFIADRIHDTLSEVPEERPKLDLSKPKPLSLLARWKIEAAKARDSSADPGARDLARWSALRT